MQRRSLAFIPWLFRWRIVAVELVLGSELYMEGCTWKH